MHNVTGQEVPQQHHKQHRGEKMRISLPREDSFRLKSPHRPTGSGHNSFSEFAGRVRSLSLAKSPSPPPLPPRAPTTCLTTVQPSIKSAPPLTTARPTGWINFEEIPEKRKAPKRIQTVPRLEDNVKHSQSGSGSAVGVDTLALIGHSHEINAVEIFVLSY